MAGMSPGVAIDDICVSILDNSTASSFLTHTAVSVIVCTWFGRTTYHDVVSGITDHPHVPV